MDFIEITSQSAPTFRERSLIYLHCYDLGAQESVQLEQFPCLQVNLVLGHVSFPEKIAERRMCGFLFQQKVLNLLKDRPSPVLIEVINSCNIKVSLTVINFLVNQLIVALFDVAKPIFFVFRHLTIENFYSKNSRVTIKQSLS